jgi:hypothetical protein
MEIPYDQLLRNLSNASDSVCGFAADLLIVRDRKLADGEKVNRFSAVSLAVVEVGCERDRRSFRSFSVRVDAELIIIVCSYLACAFALYVRTCSVTPSDFYPLRFLKLRVSVFAGEFVVDVILPWPHVLDIDSLQLAPFFSIKLGYFYNGRSERLTL